MPFIRLSDNYIDHPKFIVLSDRAFRLWHEGMAYCRKHQTDGLVPLLALRGFRYAKPEPVRELSTGSTALWEVVEGFGFRVHDYLDWNLSREEEQKRQTEARERTKKWRTKASRDASRDAHVPDRIGSDQDSSEGVQGEPASANRLLDAFRSRWKQAYGFECSLIIKPLEQMQLEQQVAAHSEPLLRRAVEAYFASSDEFVRRARHPLPLFLRDPLKYLAKEPVFSERPKGCAHQPACADAAAHTRRDMAERRQI